MLGSNCSSRSIEASEDNSATDLVGTHVPGLGTAVDDMVDRLKSEVPRHELNNRYQTHQRGPNS